jgi:hypothetical protein
MQTLSEFFKNWSPGIKQQAREIGEKVEAGENMSRFLSLEPKLRSSRRWDIQEKVYVSEERRGKRESESVCGAN